MLVLLNAAYSLYLLYVLAVVGAAVDAMPYDLTSTSSLGFIAGGVLLVVTCRVERPLKLHPWSALWSW